LLQSSVELPAVFLYPKRYERYEFISDDWEKNNLVDAQRAGGWCEPVRHDHSVTHELLLEIAYQLILVSQSSRRRLPGVSGRSAMPANECMQGGTAEIPPLPQQFIAVAAGAVL